MSYVLSRRRRRGGAVSSLRGYFSDAAMPALYVANTNVTQASGVVSQWDDARGTSGYGPPIVFAGAARPAYSVGADGVSIITGDGVDDFGTTAASPLFDYATCRAVAVIGSAPNTAQSRFLVNVGTAARFLSIYQASAGTIKGGFSVADADSTVPAAATRRLMIASFSGTTGRVDIPNHAGVTAAGNTFATGSNSLTVFNYTVAGSYCAGPIAAVVTLTRQPTAADLTALQAFAATLNYVAAT